jgi:hypothetical protein
MVQLILTNLYLYSLTKRRPNLWYSAKFCTICYSKVGTGSSGLHRRANGSQLLKITIH